MTDTPLPPKPKPPAPFGLARNSSNYGDRDFALYLRRSFAKSMGYSQAMLDKPVVGIADTASDYNNCHRTIPELIEDGESGLLVPPNDAGALADAIDRLIADPAFAARLAVNARARIAERFDVATNVRAYAALFGGG